MKDNVRALLLLVLLAPAAAPADAQDGGGWKMVGQIGGQTRGLAVRDGRAYAGIGMRLVILDASTPSALRELGASPPFAFFVEDVAVSGARAFVAAGTAGLRVVDVSNVQRPVETGSWDSRGYARAVAVAGSIAYVADGPFGLRLVDVSNPSAPIEVGSAFPANDVYDVVVEGSYAYLAAAGAGLLIADVTDPAHPVEAGRLTTAYALGVAVDGRTAWVANAWEGIVAVDVSDPRRPALQAAHATPGWAFGVTVAGTNLYVADSFRGLRVLDVGDPAHPREVAFSECAGGHIDGVVVEGGSAYVADRNHGVHAITLSGGPDLAVAGTFDAVGSAAGVTVAGTYAYVAEPAVGLVVIDVSDPAAPKEVGRCAVAGSASDVVVKGSYAYLTTNGPGNAGLHVIDVANPANPVRLGLFDKPNGQPRALDVAGDHAYVAAEDGLEILNVSDPRVPFRAAFHRTKVHELEPATTIGVTVAGTVAYLALEGGGFATVDVSNPAAPVGLGRFPSPTSSAFSDVAVSGKYAFVADSGNGLRVLDVSDPARPVEVALLKTMGQGPLRVALAGSTAYVTRGDDGLLAVDVANPLQPVIAGSHRTPGYPRRIAVASGRLYVADGSNALLILEAPGNAVATGEEPADRRPPVGPATRPSIRVPRPPIVLDAGPAVAPRAIAAAAQCVVTSANDQGAGTLRACLQNAGAGTTITFDPAVFPPASPASIRLAGGLPNLPGGVTIDGSDAGVILDGSGALPAGGGPTVFGLYSREDDIVVRGLQIVGFRGNGMQIHGRRNVIGGDRSKGRGPTGQGNVFSGNRDAGLMISGDGGAASENVVVGNFFGTSADGTRALGNGRIGLWVQRGTNNRIGGPDPADRNLVSGNPMGIIVSGRSTGNLIAGNYVGTDVTGALAIPNSCCGVYIETGAYANAFEGNLISGNDGPGIQLDDAGSNYNSITGNRIGTDATGTRANPNGHGIVVYEVTRFTRIGGTHPAERNVISGNRGYGVEILSSTGNLILGNSIGVDITGGEPLGNGFSGVHLTRSPNMLGGTTPQEANVIAASGWTGVQASGNYSTVIGNAIGSDRSGELDLGNPGTGVSLTGVDGIVQGNVVAHNGRGIAASNGTLRQNSIHHNHGDGIAAGAILAPAITAATRLAVTGTACAGCEVEIFSDSEDEGRVYEGSTFAAADGTFSYTSGFLDGPNVTATATDRHGKTSAFSKPVQLPPGPPRRRPIRR